MEGVDQDCCWRKVTRGQPSLSTKALTEVFGYERNLEKYKRDKTATVQDSGADSRADTPTKTETIVAEKEQKQAELWVGKRIHQKRSENKGPTSYQGVSRILL